MSSARRAMKIASRLFVYYLLYLVLWKCPVGTDPDTLEELPALCTPLHHGLDALSPYVSPTYHAYVQPAVQKVSPYAEKGSQAYFSYVHPAVQTVQGKVVRVAEPASDKVKDLYTNHLAEHVEKARHVHEKVSPHVDRGVSFMIERVVAPTCRVSKVCLQKSQHTLMTKVAPRVKVYTSHACVYSKHYWAKLSTWIKIVLLPRVQQIYTDRIEPQFHKIHKRIQSRQDLDESELFVNTNNFRSSVSQHVSSVTEQAASAAAAASETVADASKEISASVDSVVEEASATAEAVKSDLEHWKELVHKTTKEAFGSFLDDVEAEKSRMMEEVKPQFTELLRDLQQQQTEAVNETQRFIKRVEDGEDLAVSEMQELFRSHADKIRQRGMAVREKSESFAHEALEKSEKLRTATVDVLDEFSNVALQEIGRKLVSIDPAKSSSDKDSRNWKDWKEYRLLKDHLMDTRQEIIDHDVNMADVNKMLREAQETGNVLAKEAAQFLSNLRAKADFLFQEKAKREANSQDDEDDDIEFYDISEEEDDEEEIGTLTLTKTHTHTEVVDEETATILPIDEEVEVHEDEDEQIATILPINEEVEVHEDEAYEDVQEDDEEDEDEDEQPVSILPFDDDKDEL